MLMDRKFKIYFRYFQVIMPFQIKHFWTGTKPVSISNTEHWFVPDLISYINKKGALAQVFD